MNDFDIAIQAHEQGQLAEAIRLLLPHAQQENVVAMTIAGSLLVYRLDCFANWDEFNSWKRSQTEEAVCHFLYRTPTDSVSLGLELLRRSAAAGSSVAQNNLEVYLQTVERMEASSESTPCGGR